MRLNFLVILNTSCNVLCVLRCLTRLAHRAFYVWFDTLWERVNPERLLWFWFIVNSLKTKYKQHMRKGYLPQKWPADEPDLKCSLARHLAVRRHVVNALRKFKTKCLYVSPIGYCACVFEESQPENYKVSAFVFRNVLSNSVHFYSHSVELLNKWDNTIVF